MFRVLLTLALAVLARGASNLLESEAKIVEYENNNDGLGNYFFRFVTSNGITREETGKLVNVGLPDEHVDVEGFYSYYDGEGVLQTIKYTADTNGYVIKPYLQSNAVYSGPAPLIASLLGK